VLYGLECLWRVPFFALVLVIDFFDVSFDIIAESFIVESIGIAFLPVSNVPVAGLVSLENAAVSLARIPELVTVSLAERLLEHAARKTNGRASVSFRVVI
jgi:hypothetical protein